MPPGGGSVSQNF